MLTTCIALLIAAAPSDEAMTRFGQQLANDLRAGQPNLATNFDADAFVARLNVGLPEGFRAQGGEMRPLITMFERRIQESIRTGDVVTYVRNVRVHGEPAVQLRQLSTNGGYDFLEFLVAVSPDTTLRVTDFFVVTEGLLRSDSVRRTMLNAGRPMTAAMKFLEDTSAEVFDKAVGEGRFSDIVKGYEGFPTTKQAVPRVRTAWLKALAQLDEPRFRAEIKTLKAAEPENTALIMLASEAAAQKHDWVTYLASIDALEALVGRNAVFDVEREVAPMSQGNIAGAKKLLLSANALEPSLQRALSGLIDIANTAKDWPDLVKWLTAAETVGIRYKVESEFFAEFRASKPGQAFMKSRKKP